MIQALIRPIISPLITPLIKAGSVDTPLFSLSFTGSGLPDGVTFSRSSAATDTQSGDLEFFGIDEPRLGPKGLLIEESRTTSRTGYLDPSITAYPVNVAITQGLSDPTGGEQASQAVADSGGTKLRVASTTNYPNAYSSGDVTHLAYVKPVGNLSHVQVFGRSGSSWYCNFELLGDGAVGNSNAVADPEIRPLNDGGYIISYRPTDGGREAHLRFCFVDSLLPPRAAESTLNIGDGILVYAANAVNAFGRTSLIPGNISASATRSRDNVSFSPTSIPINSGRIEIQARTALFLDTAEQTLIHIGNSGANWHIRRDPSGKFTAWLGSASADISTSTFADDTDITLIWEWDGTSHKFTINGEATTVTGSAIDAPITTAVLGRHYGFNNEIWNGYIRSVKVYGG